MPPLPLPYTHLLQDFEGPGMVSTVDQVLGMTINGDEGEEVTFMDSGIPSPYLQVTVAIYLYPVSSSVSSVTA